MKKVLTICLAITMLFAFSSSFAFDNYSDFYNNYDSNDVYMDDNDYDDYSNDDYTEETQYDDSMPQLVILDGANLLTEEEEERLKQDMVPLTEFGNIMFLSVNDNPFASTEELARTSYYNQFGTDSGSVFLIDMDNRYIYIHSDGKNYQIITPAKAEIITDNVYRYASKQDYYSCASEAFKQMNKLLSGEKIAEPMKHISNVLIALITGAFVVFIYIMKSSKITPASSSEVLKNCKVLFKVNRVDVRKVGERRVYSPVQSESSSYSGGHSSGGRSHSAGHSAGHSSHSAGHSSHHSGGGGGHRF